MKGIEIIGHTGSCCSDSSTAVMSFTSPRQHGDNEKSKAACDYFHFMIGTSFLWEVFFLRKQQEQEHFSRLH